MDFKLARASAFLATVSGEIEFGSSFVGCFIACSDQENGEKSLGRISTLSKIRKPHVFGIPGARAPKTRRQQVHAKVQRVLVECPGLAQLLKALQLRCQVSGGVSLHSCSGAQHAAYFQAVLRCPGLVNSPFTFAGFRGGGATDCFLRCRDVLTLRRRERLSSEKTLERYVQEGVCHLESLFFPTRAGSCLSRHRPQWAGGESELCRRLTRP